MVDNPRINVELDDGAFKVAMVPRDDIEVFMITDGEIDQLKQSGKAMQAYLAMCSACTTTALSFVASVAQMGEQAPAWMWGILAAASFLAIGAGVLTWVNRQSVDSIVKRLRRRVAT